MAPKAMTKEKNPAGDTLPSSAQEGTATTKQTGIRWKRVLGNFTIPAFCVACTLCPQAPFSPADVLRKVGLDNLLVGKSGMYTVCFALMTGWVTFFLWSFFFYLVDMGILAIGLKKVQPEYIPTPDAYKKKLRQAGKSLLTHMAMMPVASWYKTAVTGVNPLPPQSWSEIPVDFLKFITPFSLWFYLVHRALHIPCLYGRFHKLHHEFHAPSALDGVYFTTFEFLIGNLIPSHLFLGFCCRSVWTEILFGMLILQNAALSHCGYDMAPLCGTEHDPHHEFFNVNYGAGLKIWDKMFGTYVDEQEAAERRGRKAERKLS